MFVVFSNCVSSPPKNLSLAPPLPHHALFSRDSSAPLNKATGQSIAQTDTEGLRTDNVPAFLDYAESRRSNYATTRNHRLAVLRSIARHSLHYELSHTK